ncbi:Xylanolytic transcriptional activator xlnR [Fusarium oxysporum f. sp. albedinis]|nr:Xylanolytic transcriptional activator xlnR [Fusarium oxysporum f. sp. albedinis]
MHLESIEDSLLLISLNFKFSSLPYRIIRIHDIYHEGYPPVPFPHFLPNSTFDWLITEQPHSQYSFNQTSCQ